MKQVITKDIAIKTIAAHARTTVENLSHLDVSVSRGVVKISSKTRTNLVELYPVDDFESSVEKVGWFVDHTRYLTKLDTLLKGADLQTKMMASALEHNKPALRTF